MNRRRERSIEPQTAVAVIDAADATRGEDERDRRGRKHVIGRDPFDVGCAPRVITRRSESFVRCELDERDRTAMGDLERRDDERLHDATRHVLVRTVPRNVCDDPLEGRCVEQRTTQALAWSRPGPRDEACNLRTHVGFEAQRAPVSDETRDATIRCVRVGDEMCGVDGADGCARQHVEERRPGCAVTDDIEDASEHARLVRSTSATPRKDKPDASVHGWCLWRQSRGLHSVVRAKQQEALRP